MLCCCALYFSAPLPPSLCVGCQLSLRSLLCLLHPQCLSASTHHALSTTNQPTHKHTSQAGGISPVTRDYVNPEKAWPHLQPLTAATAAAGKLLLPRLPVYPHYLQVCMWGWGWGWGWPKSYTLRPKSYTLPAYAHLTHTLVPNLCLFKPNRTSAMQVTSALATIPAAAALTAAAILPAAATLAVLVLVQVLLSLG